MFRKARFGGVFAMLLSAAVCMGDVVTVQPVDDAYLSSAGPSLPYNEPVLEQFGYYSSIKRPLLKFDLSSIPDSAKIRSAQLTLQLTGIYGGQGHFSSAWRMPNDNWTEETVTWNSYDQTGAVSVAILPGTNDVGLRAWNIRIAEWTYADDLLDNAVTFMVRWDDSGSEYETDGYYKWNTYSSKEGTISPTLRIEFGGRRGDANCDGGVDFFDIDPFLLALFDPPQYLATYCEGSLVAADCDCSNAIDFFDIDPFLACLFGGCAACP